MLIKVKDTNLVIAGVYIPPSNSTYFSSTYFNNLKMIYEFACDKHLLFLGDLNARTSTPTIRENKYTKNPDETKNKNGKTLFKICEETWSSLQQ